MPQNRKKTNILEEVLKEYHGKKSCIYKALGWSRQRYKYWKDKGEATFLMNSENIEALAKALNITPLELKTFLFKKFIG